MEWSTSLATLHSPILMDLATTFLVKAGKCISNDILGISTWKCGGSDDTNSMPNKAKPCR